MVTLLREKKKKNKTKHQRNKQGHNSHYMLQGIYNTDEVELIS